MGPAGKSEYETSSKGWMRLHNSLHVNGLAAALTAAILFSCSGGAEQEEQAGAAPEKKPEYVAFAEFVNEEDSLPRLRFFESGLVSLNDRCPVRMVKLSPKMPPAWVNGRPIGFC